MADKNNLLLRITPRRGHFFHGFYNIQPWDVKERYFLCHGVDFIDRMPAPRDQAVVGMVDFLTKKFVPLDKTHAWNFQQGALVQWVTDTEIIYNTRNEKGLASVVLDVFTGKKRQMPQAIYAAASNGEFALGYDFARKYQLNPGYGYAGVPYDIQARPIPDDEGIMRLDIESGTREMIISFKQIAEEFWIDEMENNPGILGGFQLNKNNTRFAFAFRFWTESKRYTSLISANVDGSQMYQAVDFFSEASHYDWWGDDYLLVWSKMPGTDGPCFNLVKDREGSFEPVGKGKLTVDGHCSYSPDGTTVLTDTFTQPDGKLHLMLYDTRIGKKTELGRFKTFERPMGDLRCDLHPCWSRSGHVINFDSVHEGGRGVYVIQL